MVRNTGKNHIVKLTKKVIMHKYLRKILSVLSISLLLHVISFSQDIKTAVVMDENDNVIAGAKIFIDEDSKPVSTNEQGEFQFAINTSHVILVEHEGFESLVINYSPGTNLNNIILKKLPFHLSEKDVINIPFGQMKRRQNTGSISTFLPEEILSYDYASSISGIINGRAIGTFGSSSIRNFGNPIYVVDGIVRPINDYLNIHEIEQISLLKDMSTAMLYGPQAINGVISITTKRGTPLKRSLRIVAENGISVPISYPSYLSAADYMELYNEARLNDNLTPKYSSELIENTRNGVNTLRYPDESYYNSVYLKDWSNYNRINAELKGGNQTGQFFMNVGWNRSNSLLKLGEGAKEKSDQINFRGNVNYNVSDFIRLTFDGSVVFDFSNGPRYSNGNFWQLASTLRPDIYPVLIPVDSLKPLNLFLGANPVGNYVFGGTSEYQTNIYGELTKNGTQNSMNRLMGITTGLDFDLSKITPGLKSKVYYSYNMFNMYNELLGNTYAVYNAVYAADTIKSFNKYKTDLRLHAKDIGDAFYYRMTGVYGFVDYEKIYNEHNLTATALIYLDEFAQEGILQNEKHLHFGGRINYMFQNKYVAELTGVRAGSLKLFEANRWSFSPGVGLAWIVTEEDFLKENSILNYLKIRTNFAILQTDANISYGLDRDYYTNTTRFTYGHGGGYNNAAKYLYRGNSNLEWEKILNTNIGFESMLLNYSIGIEASYFYYKYYDIITRRVNTLPEFFGNFPSVNYESNQTQGVEAGLFYKFNLNNLQLDIGGNIVYSVPKNLVLDEIEYDYDYLFRSGQPTDGIYALTAIGFFKDEEDIDNSPFQTFGMVQPGDIKYKDINNDGIIDSDDVSLIGFSKPRLDVGFHLHLQYKSFSLFALGSGQFGRDRFYNNEYYWIFGDRKYSEVIKNRWTPETSETATYPRLTSSTSSNNFRNSTFWLYRTNFFTLRTMQLTYNILGKNFFNLQDASVFIRGNNLLMISREKEKLQLNVGSRPQLRSFSLGVNLKF